MRSRRSARALAPAFLNGAVRDGFRLVHFAVMGNHMHLIVEARDEKKLANGLKGLGVRVARALNRLMRQPGKVINDRYHAVILRSPTQVRHARQYLLDNAKNHYGWQGPDPYAPKAPLALPHTWLLRMTC
jgi:REP element-mobilizing transposase RayT